MAAIVLQKYASSQLDIDNLVNADGTRHGRCYYSCTPEIEILGWTEYNTHFTYDITNWMFVLYTGESCRLLGVTMEGTYPEDPAKIETINPSSEQIICEQWQEM